MEQEASEALGEQAADFIFGQDPEAPPQEEVEATEEPEEQEASEDESEDESEDKDAPEDESEVEAEFVEVEVNGKLYEVPVELQDSLLRQEDYTKKTQEVASQRKEAEVQLGQVKQQMQEFEFANSVRDDVMKAQQLEARAEEYNEYLRANIEQLSPTEIEKIKFGIEDARRERDDLVSSVHGKHKEFQQAQEQSFTELLKKGTEVLQQKIPGWGEDQQKQVRDYALSNGFTEAEISQVVDPRQVEVLYKASQYDSLKQGAAPAVKKVSQTPTIKPKARNPMPDDVKRKLNLRNKLKSTKLTQGDKANLIGEDIAGKFGM